MLQNYIILFLLTFCTSCLGLPLPCNSIYESESLSDNTKTLLCRNGHYKYRCKKAGDCCEVGKDCEGDSKKKEVKE